MKLPRLFKRKKANKEISGKAVKIKIGNKEIDADEVLGINPLKEGEGNLYRDFINDIKDGQEYQFNLNLDYSEAGLTFITLPLPYYRAKDNSIKRSIKFLDPDGNHIGWCALKDDVKEKYPAVNIEDPNGNLEME